MNGPILVVGAGNMGFAMISAWRDREPEVPVLVVEPAEALTERARSVGARIVACAEDLPEEEAPKFAVFAVKPQVIDDIVPNYRHLAERGTCFVSVVAGTPMATPTEGVGSTNVVRCMPNTPAAIGEGVVACVADRSVSGETRDQLSRLLAHLGDVHWLEDEGQMDAVTAISGSGPAYVFHFIECLTEAGVALGLERCLAEKMACQTVAGAGRLARSTETLPSTLREQATSPGGTTAAALEVLMAESGLGDLVKRGSAAAYRRSIDLRKGA